MMNRILGLLTRDTRLLELWNVQSLLLVGLFFNFIYVPENLVQYQLHFLWMAELIFLAVVHFISIYATPLMALRAWCLFLSGFFWAMLAFTSLGEPSTQLNAVISFGLSLSCFLAFLSRGVKRKWI